ncbi:MAG: GAF domain-containing protein [Gemmatimonadaceae bacterium]|nr:GAF domain-containing protein [Gemmatimonadaceae bacterium]
MPAAPIPTNEGARLEALRRYDILDTAPETVFDDLVYLSTFVTGSPIATFTLIDAHRQWFKSQIGMASQETTRDVAFCAYTILQDDVLVVPDATQDPRFADNPLVIEDPGIRFYAGVPVRSREGLNIGTVCVIDHQPRRALLDHQRVALEAIARQASAMLELRRTAAELAAVTRDLCPDCQRTIRNRPAR